MVDTSGKGLLSVQNKKVIISNWYFDSFTELYNNIDGKKPYTDNNSVKAGVSMWNYKSLTSNSSIKSSICKLSYLRISVII